LTSQELADAAKVNSEKGHFFILKEEQCVFGTAPEEDRRTRTAAFLIEIQISNR
jgi:hypothetical protein